MGTKRVEKKRNVQKPVTRVNSDGVAYTDYQTVTETYFEDVYVPDSSPSYDSGPSSVSYDSGPSYSGDSGGGSW